MSSTFGAEPVDGSDFAAGSPYRGQWRRSRGCGASWSAAELLAIVIGFMVYWPIGVAILACKLIQRRRGPGETWFEAVRSAFAGGAASFGRDFGWGHAGTGNPSGNSAFDAWRAAEIERLEAERRKLEEARRAFAAFAEEARRARDKEEFERFMARRPPA